MKKYVNGRYCEMTAEEIFELQKEAERLMELEKGLPPTAEERLAAMESALIALMGVI